MANNQIEVEIVLDDGSIRQGFAKVQNQGKKTASGLNAAFAGVGASIAKLAVSLGAAFAGFKVFEKIIRNTKDFETALSEVNTITNLSVKENRALTDQLLRLSSQFGTSQQEQAKTFYRIISAGVTDTEKANRLLIASNKLAIGGITSNAEAVGLLTGAVNAFSKSGLTAERAADILFKTVEAGDVTIGSLGQNLGRLLAPASTLGVSFVDVNAAVADLTTKSINLSEAVTGVRAIFTGLITNQEKAAKQGGKVAEAFNLQALAAKDFDKFLKDVVDSVGGNESALQKLFGSAEAVNTVLAFTTDNFEGLSNRIDNISNSAGSADAAFQEIEKTFSQQLNKATSAFNEILTRLGLIFKDNLTGSVKSARFALESFLEVLRDPREFIESVNNILNAFIRLGAQIALVGIILKRQAIFALISKGALAAKTSLVTLKTAFIALRSSSIAAAAGFEIFIRNLKLAKVAVIAFKAAATIGISLVLDDIISKFLLFRDAGQDVGSSLSSTFKLLGLQIQSIFIRIQKSIADLLSKLPLVGGDFKALSDGSVIELEKINAKIKEIQDSALAASQQEVIPSIGASPEAPAPKPPPGDEENQESPFAFADAFGATLTGFNEKIESTKEQSVAAFKEIGKAAKTQFAGSIGGAFAAFGSALAKGENGLKAFTEAFLQAIGQQAIQLGTSFILEGIARSFIDPGTGSGLIAAGAALAAFGGALTAVGGSSSKGGASAAAGPAPITDVRADDPFEVSKPETKVDVQITGNVLNTRESAQNIVDLINESFDTEGTVIARA